MKSFIWTAPDKDDKENATIFKAILVPPSLSCWLFSSVETKPEDQNILKPVFPVSNQLEGSRNIFDV